MSLLSGLKEFLTGSSLVKEVGDIVKAYWPPDLSPEKRLEFELHMAELDYQRTIKTMDAIGEAERNLNQRIAEQEGTASDLKSLPVLGNFMLFLRGSQRPVWGFSTMYMDYQVFSGVWVLTAGQQEAAFYVINFLVLGFLFGERTIQNVLPVIGQYFGKGATK